MKLYQPEKSESFFDQLLFFAGISGFFIELVYLYLFVNAAIMIANPPPMTNIQPSALLILAGFMIIVFLASAGLCLNKFNRRRNVDFELGLLPRLFCLFLLLVFGYLLLAIIFFITAPAG